MDFYTQGTSAQEVGNLIELPSGTIRGYYRRTARRKPKVSWYAVFAFIAFYAAIISGMIITIAVFYALGVRECPSSAGSSRLATAILQGGMIYISALYIISSINGKNKKRRK